jgi:hypothetical protein
MKTACAMLGMSLVVVAQASAADNSKSTTTIMRSPHGTAVITQSGDPSTATTKIERKKGSTTITRKSGGNSSTIIQGGDPRDLPADVMTPEMRQMLDLLGK